MSFDQSILQLNFKLFRISDRDVNWGVSSLILHQLFSVVSALPLSSQVHRCICKILDIPHSSEATQRLKNSWHEFLSYNNAKNGPLKILLEMFTTAEIVSADVRKLIESDFLGQIIPVDSGDKKWTDHVEDWFKEFMDTDELKKLHYNLTKIYMKTGLLMNTFLFKFDWDPLVKWAIVPNYIFFIGSNEFVKTDMLFEQTELPYFYDKSLCVQILKIPYNDPSYYILFVLPEDINQLESELIQHHDILQDWKRSLVSIFIAVYLPRFTVKNEIKISNDFLRFTCEKNSPGLSLLAQKTQLTVSEGKKRKTSSVSGLIVNSRVRQSGIPVFKANKPYLYFIYHNNLLLYMGRLVNPQKY